jgi:hypothetical protein
MNPLEALFELGKVAIEKVWPDPSKRAEELYKLEKLYQDGDLAKLQAAVNLTLGQIEINKIEAQHPSVFVAGWRPAVGWVGASAFAYSTIIEPFMRFVATLCGYVGSFPELSDDLTMQILLGLLGLGALRSFDKKNEVQTDRTGK